MRRNWKASFGDTDEYLDFFFSGCFRTENTVVCVVENTVVSQLFLLPATLRNAGETYPVCYLYAAATHPDYRGNGYMAQLIRAAEMLCRKRGLFGIVLLPASESLYHYYERFGYETAFARRVWRISRAELEAAAFDVQISEEKSETFLEQYSTQYNGIVWSTKQLQYALAEHRTFRGAYGTVNSKAFVSTEESEACILSEPEDLRDGCAALLKLSDAEHFCVTLPPEHATGELQKGGMIRFLSDRIKLNNAFIPFTLE